MLFVTIFSAVVIVFLVALAIAWRRTDWKKLDKANEAFLDADGNHSYYDRKRSASRQRAESRE